MGAKSSYVPDSSDIPDACNSANRNSVLCGCIVNWDESDIGPGPYDRKIGRGMVMNVLESPFLLVRRIGRGAGDITPTCTFVLSMFEVRTMHVFKTLNEEEAWYAWSVTGR